MAFKFVVLFALISFAKAGIIPAAQHVYSAPVGLFKGASSGYSAQAGYNAPNEYTQKLVYAQPKASLVLSKSDEEYDSHPQYKFGYDIQDTLSGDSKTQVESRDGDVVRGEYSLIDADGYKRRVQYTADSVHGFNAIVTREPLNAIVKTAIAPAAVKAAVPVAYPAAPVSVKYTDTPKQLLRSAQAAYDDGPVVKGAYAEKPIVKAVPVAYPISKVH